MFTQLARQVALDLQRKGYEGRTVGIKLRFDDFKTVTRDLTLEHPTADADAVRHAAGLCLKRVDLSRRMRLLGVRAGALARLADLVAPSTAPPAHVAEAGPPSYAGLPLFDAAGAPSRT